MNKHFSGCIVLLVIFFACQPGKSENKAVEKTILINDPHFSATVILKKLHSLAGYKLSVKSKNGISSLHIKDQIFSFQRADVDEDGKTDILLGITKKTHFEPVMEKRLQIFRIDSGRLRPLWLGSRLCRKLVDFKPVSSNGKCEIATIEQDEKGFYQNGHYEWQDFGLRLIAYKTEKLVYSKAKQFFQHEHKPG